MKTITTLTLALLLPLLACCHRAGTINKSSDNAPDNFTHHLGVTFGQSPLTLYKGLANISVYPSTTIDDFTSYAGAFDFNGDVYSNVTFAATNGRISAVMYELNTLDDNGEAMSIYYKYKELYKADIFHEANKKDPYLLYHLYNDSILVEVNCDDESNHIMLTITDYKLYDGDIPAYAEIAKNLKK